MSKTNQNDTHSTSNRRRIILSTLWIFVMFNYTYCDIFGLMDPNILNQYMTGNVDGMIINESVLFYGVILMEIPIAMILLSRILPYKWNKVLNIIAALIKTLIMLGTFLIGSVASYYLFFAIIEISTTLFIIVYAWTWKERSNISKMVPGY